ncbi:PREDICTED: uncharacterized protein LOC109176630 isoform X1 [Ipomoea nil]|uniref:uncharacterized protein LOC109176630 isoform X1 n=1 Tax=Ipomoea nil TaxID=35883 RepID=UPI000901B65E|nr:PREDICTED: uncharacterized protein LOC109176630 isoform X1 [Ipomoea nil]
MSGMLPGVECARRRRLHQSNRVLLDSPSSPSAYFSSTRKSFFCLYTSNNSSPSMQGSGLTQAYHDEMMGEVAREAKQRLDEKLRARWKPDHKRNGKRPEMGILQRVDLGLKNTGLNKLCCARNSGFEGLGNLEK